MKQVFDPIELINETVMSYFEKIGCIPKAVVISPSLYRRLLEIRSSDESFGSLLIGCSPFSEITTARGNISIIIDEMIPDTVVEIIA